MDRYEIERQGLNGAGDIKSTHPEFTDIDN
jgi:hypothetical protein